MKILIVDDSTFSQKTTIKALKTIYPDATYETADDGIEGIQLYGTFLPDYVFMDLLMPNMNGQEAIVHLLEKFPEAKIIVLSADVQAAVREEVLAAGAIKFINKPINADKLGEIKQLIEG
ncbi:response regulator [Lysinibacillus piscis]|uniref:Transcriptional regulator n=1 Tax=Lysinibacillus piscis TaxID=2518931 RepID=A0ABQ5NN25_9BACI|nr:response regulator [Lysinibacillus sp. KH24]GLC89645.1 transcriptional regulator [Lysinibacillus sp. KH24]